MEGSALSLEVEIVTDSQGRTVFRVDHLRCQAFEVAVGAERYEVSAKEQPGIDSKDPDRLPYHRKARQNARLEFGGVTNPRSAEQDYENQTPHLRRD